MIVVERVKNILLRPAKEWPVIAGEATDAKALFLGYAAPLAAIGPIATWIGHSLIGVSVPLLGTVRTPFLTGLVYAVVAYLLVLAATFAVGLIIDALAPSFGGEKNAVQAMKCAVYAYTPAWVAGILHVFPELGILALLASLYGIYLLYLGLPVLMKVPQEKAARYTIVIVICAIALSVVLGVIGGVVGFAGGTLRGSGDAYLGQRHEAAPAPGSVLGKLDVLGKKLEETNRKMEEANRKGDTAAAAGAAMEGLATMVGGGRKVEPVAVERLKAFLPETLDGMPRADVTTEQTSFGSLSVTTANAIYQDGNRKIRLGVGDMAAVGGLFALTAIMGAGQTKESDAGYEKMHRVDGRIVIEKQDRRTGAAEYGVVLADRFVVNARSGNVDASSLRALIAKLDTAKLEAMKDVGVTK